MQQTKKVEYAKMHCYLYDHKPPNISVFNFMRKLFYEAGLFDKENKMFYFKIKKGRKGTNTLNTDDQLRKVTGATVVTQHHKKGQEQLMVYLKEKYPNAKITFKKDFIDLLLV